MFRVAALCRARQGRVVLECHAATAGQVNHGIQVRMVEGLTIFPSQIASCGDVTVMLVKGTTTGLAIGYEHVVTGMPQQAQGILSQCVTDNIFHAAGEKSHPGPW